MPYSTKHANQVDLGKQVRVARDLATNKTENVYFPVSRQIVDNLQPKMTKEKMTKGNVIVFSNLKQRKHAGKHKTEGMILCASKQGSDKEQICLFKAKEFMKPGTRLHLETQKPYNEHQILMKKLRSNSGRRLSARMLEKLQVNDKKELIYDNKWKVMANNEVVTAA